MGEYVKSKKDMRFQSQDALKTVQSVIDDADLALNDKSRRMSELYLGGSVVGLSAAGITSGLAAAGGLIGGGMVAGIAVLAAPAVALGGISMGVASHVRNKKLREAKELIYKNAIAKQTAIVKALKQETDADKERIDYLNGLNILLQAAIKDLKHDLGIS